MPITKSAKRAWRKSEKRRTRNLQRMKKIKSHLKEVRNLVSQKKIEEAQKLLPQVYKILDKAAKIGLIKKNTAARKKSRIAEAILKSR